MTNFRRALLALFTFVGITAGSLVVAPGLVSAHDATATPACTGLSWNAHDYETAQTNKITVTVDGVVVYSQADFPQGDVGTWPWTQTVNHSWSVVIDVVQTNTYDKNFSGTWVACKPLVNPTAPTVSHTTVCGATDTYTIPTTANVTYKVDGTTKAAGTYPLAAGVTVNIVASTDANHTIGTPNTWAFTGSIVETCKPDDGYTDRTDNGVCVNGQNTVDVKVYRTPFTWAYNAQTNTWTKVFGAEFLLSTTPRQLTAQEQIDCKPSYDPLVVVVETPCTSGATQVTITTTTTTYHAEFQQGAWVKVADTPTVVVTHRSLTQGEKVTCVPTHQPKVVTTDDGTPKCGDTSVATTTTTTTYTYTYEYVNDVPTWVEHTTVVVTHGSRAVQTDPCPTTTTTPPTTVPPTTTIPTCFYNGNLPADSPLCVAPTTTTVAPATTVSIPPNVALPRTGGGTSGPTTIGGILVGAGILALAATRRRKVRNV